MNSSPPPMPPMVTMQAPELPPDPMMDQLKSQAQSDNFKALSSQAASDTAAVMARYGRSQGAGTATTAPVVNLTTAAPAAAAPATPDPMTVARSVLSSSAGAFPALAALYAARGAA